ncbi:hypothetical protein MLD38_005590 [Melastoma candidum]|uniref:Uncharacterized protein n=1 Tax=Melastoma candidum TaxID=119954 RepID=A0ACB9RM37_9MYRT|nr:hypothetical protein MLD38_005590 [Melastoma candidum]
MKALSIMYNKARSDHPPSSHPPVKRKFLPLPELQNQSASPGWLSREFWVLSRGFHDGSRNCFGRGSNTKTIASMNAQAKESEIHVQQAKNPRKSEDYWSSSTFDMDNNSTFQSQGSISSISTSTADPHGGSNNSTTHSEFVNHGLILWNQTRQRWIGNKKLETSVQQPRETKLNWNVTYESLLGTDKPFPRPVPLSEMVDFLVDTWDQEGLYD